MQTKIYDLNDEQTYPEALSVSADTIRNGGLVVFPTETVYGLGANALDEKAVAKIFKAKGRPQDNPLIVHLTDKNDIKLYAKNTSRDAEKIIQHFMPGAITIVLKKRECIPNNVSAGLDTIGIRVPNSRFAHDFLKTCEVPVAAPSANLSGKPSATLSKHVLDDMDGKVDVILIGGSCEIGLESTVVDLTSKPAKILRPGGVSIEQLSKYIEVQDNKKLSTEETPKSPGMKYTHYKPDARVVALHGKNENIVNYINKFVSNTDQRTAAIVFDNMIESIDSVHRLSLGDQNESSDAAKVLFAHLRKCDELNIEVVFVACMERCGLGEAYMNRLLKAADRAIDTDLEDDF